MSEARAEVDIAANLARIRERIGRAAERAGRRPEEILLVAVAKGVTPARIRQAVAAGVTDIAENYVQEAAAKRPEVAEAVRWHLIGHLQRNKAGPAARLFDIVHTLDSLRLAQALGRRAAEVGRRLDVLIQVNTSGEPSKSGAAPEEAERLAEAVAAVEGLRLQGLMTIGRWDPFPERARPEFRLLAEVGRRLQAGGLEMRWLSMGMTHDLEVAIEEGANLVRIGTGIFGPRGPQPA